MTVEEKIERALFSRAETFSYTPSIVVSFPNRPLSAPPSTYVEVSHLRNTNQQFAAKARGTTQLQGILQMTVVAPLGNGPSYSTRIAGAIADHFYFGLALFFDGVKVNITARPTVATPFKDREVSWNVPVSIPYDVLA